MTGPYLTVPDATRELDAAYETFKAIVRRRGGPWRTPNGKKVLEWGLVEDIVGFASRHDPKNRDTQRALYELLLAWGRLRNAEQGADPSLPTFSTPVLGHPPSVAMP